MHSRRKRKKDMAPPYQKGPIPALGENICGLPQGKSLIPSAQIKEAVLSFSVVVFLIPISK
jgi:hypothetical protein